jgi:MYXO-CTERM domain-containing protein
VHTRRAPSIVAATLILSAASHALADPETLVDRSALGASADGDVSAGEYSDTSAGINAGFGNILGSGTSYGVEADLLGSLTFGLGGSAAGSCQAQNTFVVYLDTRPGGFGSTAAFSDNADKHRAAISAMGTAGPGRADVTFASGFEADFAIAIDRNFAGLWELQGGASHAFVKGLTLTPAGGSFDTSCNHELSGLALADLGVARGGAFRYVVTLLNPLDGAGAFRSNELHGVAGTTIPGGNPGASAIALAAGDFNTFDSLEVLINEVDADTPGTDTLELVELYDGGVGNVDLDGLVLVFFNGGDGNDGSYRALDLDALATDPSGYFVAGSALVTGVDLVFPNDGLQNGQDAVGLYLASATDFPADTTPSATSLLDALVYDTSDADDATLLATLTPGEPQIDENLHASSATESMQRCGGGALQTAGYVVTTPTPDGANACPVCGNGAVEAGEACDDGDGLDTVGCNNACSACAADYYGANCSVLCQAAISCSGNGSCDAVTGLCNCAPGFLGTSCDMTQCGDGITAGAETCDDGMETAACDDDCTAVACGDGNANAAAGEGCDDGDSDNGDDCPDGPGGSCDPAACGDGFVDAEGAMTEACDGDGMGLGGETALCDDDCTAPVCGDMHVNNTAGETCDDGVRTATCDADCSDGVVNMANGELCDGNSAGIGGETAICDTDCTPAMCGDMVVNMTAMEDCDAGMETAACDDDCTDAVCGDGHVNALAGEGCDDGNTTAGDGCDGACMDEGMGGMGGSSGGMGGSSGGMGGSSGGMGGSSGGMGGSSGIGASGGIGATGGDDSAESGGCDCRMDRASGGGDARAYALVLALALALARRRRKR